MVWKQTMCSIVSLGMLGALLTACSGATTPAAGGNDNSVAQKTSEPPAPVKLIMMQDGATITKEEFETLIAAPVKAKYPHITVELVINSKADAGVQDFIASGEFPDLIFSTYPRITNHRDLKTVEDLNPFVANNKIDLKKYDPAALQTAQVYSGDGKLYALPFSLNFTATFYNKDLFDRFGVPYPKDGMTWDDALDTTKKMSRVMEGIEYKGAFVQGIGDVATQLSLPLVDPKTGKANLASQDGWKKLFDLYKAFNDIPNNTDASTATTLTNGFLKDQKVAMAISYDARIAALEKLYGTPQDFNWDLTQFPSFKEKPNTTVASSGHFLLLSSLGKHKEDAFKVIEMLGSSEVQKLITDHGRFTALSDQSIKEMYGNNMKSLKGKNSKAVFKSQFAAPVAPHTNNAYVLSHVNKALTRVLNGEIDVNTAIREAEEAANKEIAEKGK
ncbi:ABC transporter substrate-binding protein [Paenibacillus hodogayensis]|uniref:ABC transporter substrate-binding protein n=1 Tax=Paenibacillus hodogayensis TaxID=279208 RepID=A0ABV5VQ20_9BACL